MYALGRGGLFSLVAAVISVLAFAAPAAAHPQEEANDPAKALVQQAIALIVNTPDNLAAIEEHIHRAQEAPDQEGVDPDLLEQAAEALTDGDLARTQELLLDCIGARPVLGNQPPAPIRESSGEPAHEEDGHGATEEPADGEPVSPGFVVGAQPGTTVVLDAYEPSAEFDGAGIALLALSVLAVAAGTFLSWRGRPLHGVRQLRRAGAKEGEA
jgi:hypothetical protein